MLQFRKYHLFEGVIQSAEPSSECDAYHHTPDDLVFVDRRHLFMTTLNLEDPTLEP